MIEVRNLTKRYGNKLAVNDISFDVNEGEILGFLGPNGAGKTTTMNIITGYLSATEGSVKIDGVDILENPLEAKRKIGYLPEQPPLYFDMTVEEYLSFVFDLKGVKLPKKAHIEEICKLVKIDDVYKRMIKNLSKGYKQRVGVAQALLGNPPVLILDEPTVGLDPRQIIEIRNLIKSLGRNHTIILSSHILPEVQAVCEKVVVINNGSIVANDTPENLSHMVDHSRKLQIRICGPVDEVQKALKALDGIRYAECIGKKESDAYDYIIEAVENIDVRKPLFKMIAQHGWYLIGSKSMDMSLEDVFIQLVNSETGFTESKKPETPAKDNAKKQEDDLKVENLQGKEKEETTEEGEDKE
ncbi:MAG: ATP-binding cassette domain-containing protein [Bacillota bacterium]|nr:ATP-binding cassette domain-containing protein [Bacillota bacterium]